MSDNYWNTSVSVSKSKGDIDKLLRQWDVEKLGVWEDTRRNIIGVQFEYNSIPVEFKLFIDTLIEIRMEEKPNSSESTWRAKAPRMALRVLYYHLKAALIAVEYGIIAFEDIFLSHVLMLDGKTIGEIVVPNLEAVVHEPGRLASVTDPARRLPAGGK